jgi:UDP-3-O-[3-hydroxymyristoyl] glucosamine N-acyltransferase
MNILHPVSVKVVAQLIKAKIIGNADNLMHGINEIHKVRAGDLTFVDVAKYYKKAISSAATIIIIDKETDCPPDKTLLVCENPFEAYQALTLRFCPPVTSSQAISPDAVIGEGTRIDANVVIYPNVQIGKNCHIRANVTIYERTIIGDNVIIQSNSVIGGDAFYYKKENGAYQKWHSCGRTILQDDVEIGAGCTIDKGVSGDTIIGKGTKIDNHVHIAHGVEIGEHSLIAAQVGVAGKTIIGKNVILWGQVGVSKDLKIADNVQVYAQSGVSNDLAEGKAYFGSPAMDAKEWFSEYRFLRTLRNRFKSDK